MELKDLKEEHKLFEVIAGSIAYGTNTPESDIDIRGIFMQRPVVDTVTLWPKPELPQVISDTTNDISFYGLEKYLKLAADCNPNIIELLWTPDDCLKVVHPLMGRIIANRELFISKKAYHTFSGYAYAQIKRCKGQNKWVNNPQPETAPDKLDFCWFVDPSYDTWTEAPCRPVRLKNTNIDLAEYHVAKMEHAPNTYRLYHYGEGEDGVFRGEGQELVCEPIPKRDEWSHFTGLLIFAQQAYEAAKQDWKNYHDWLKNRNEARYRSQEAGEIDYDAKNVMHCMRLLWSGENILLHGEPIVRFEGEKLKVLMDIRNGKYKYDDVIELCDNKMEDLKRVKEESTLPEESNKGKIDELYESIIEEFWNL
jgi:predicted nucleotidyltransferase